MRTKLRNAANNHFAVRNVKSRPGTIYAKFNTGFRP